jgi:hypothetical protein
MLKTFTLIHVWDLDDDKIESASMTNIPFKKLVNAKG